MAARQSAAAWLVAAPVMDTRSRHRRTGWDHIGTNKLAREDAMLAHWFKRGKKRDGTLRAGSNKMEEIWRAVQARLRSRRVVTSS